MFLGLSFGTRINNRELLTAIALRRQIRPDGRGVFTEHLLLVHSKSVMLTLSIPKVSIPKS